LNATSKKLIFLIRSEILDAKGIHSVDCFRISTLATIFLLNYCCSLLPLPSSASQTFNLKDEFCLANVVLVPVVLGRLRASDKLRSISMILYGMEFVSKQPTHISLMNSFAFYSIRRSMRKVKVKHRSDVYLEFNANLVYNQWDLPVSRDICH
jgi:hypothetical protein